MRGVAQTRRDLTFNGSITWGYPSVSDLFRDASKETRFTDFCDLFPVNE